MKDANPAARKAFKDYFDRAAAKALGTQVHEAYPAFDRAAFVRDATRDLGPLAFAARVQRFSDALKGGLPDDVPKALAILTESLPPPLPDCEAVTDGWLQWPIGQFIADHGVPHFGPSMVAMEALTQRFSSEFAVRPFVEHRPKETFKHLRGLTAHDSPHVRRWCSEGVRPRLPWGKKLRALIDDPKPIWPILEALKDDEERYVNRSVANTLNDITKDHPDRVVERCRRWMKAKDKPARRWTVNHALRTLIKAGDPAALELIGFGPADGVTAQLVIEPKRIPIGGVVELTAEIATTQSRSQELLIDYVVDFVRANGKASPKVFKWTKARLAARGSTTVVKKHAFRPTTSRTLFPGPHRFSVQINGAPLAEATIVLTE